MSEAKHTPEPWFVHVESGKLPKILAQSDSMPIAYAALTRRDGKTAYNEIAANAEFIVRAVNCHDELLEALQLFLQCARRIDYDENSWVFVEAVDAAHAAIAKATGE